MRGVAASVATISTMAPKRSDQGARLRNSHHKTIANAPKSPPNNPSATASGSTTGTTNLITANSTPATTPGHSRSGFREVGSSGCAIVIDRTKRFLRPVGSNFLLRPEVPGAVGESIALNAGDLYSRKRHQVRAPFFNGRA